MAARSEDPSRESLELREKLGLLQGTQNAMVGTLSTIQSEIVKMSNEIDKRLMSVAAEFDKRMLRLESDFDKKHAENIAASTTTTVFINTAIKEQKELLDRHETKDDERFTATGTQIINGIAMLGTQITSVSNTVKTITTVFSVLGALGLGAWAFVSWAIPLLREWVMRH